MWLCVNGWKEKERDERKTLCVCGLGWEREREREMKLIRGEILPPSHFFCPVWKVKLFKGTLFIVLTTF